MSTFILYPESNDSANFHEELVQALTSRGWQKVQHYDNADYQIYTLHPRLLSRQTRYLLSRTSRKVLLRFEPSVVNPLLYSKRIENLYDQVLNVGQVNTGVKGLRVIRWPYRAWSNPAIPSRNSDKDPERLLKDSSSTRRDKRCVMVASRKLPFSRNDNYQVRSQIARFRHELGVQVYGMKWGESRWKLLKENLRIYLFFLSQLFIPNPAPLVRSFLASKQEDISEVDDKFEILLRSDFSLVIENSDEYVSEKILDAFVAGSIPLYRGPDLDQFGIPNSSYIRMPQSLRDIPNVLENLADDDVEVLRQSARDFCQVPEGLASWSPSEVAQVVADAIMEVS